MSGGEGSRFDLVIRATTIHTLDEGSDPSPTVLAVKNGAIAALGYDTDFAEWATQSDQTLDLGDATVTPGLVDNHIHPVLGIELAQGPDLSSCTTESAVVETLRKELDRLADDEWLIAWGLDLNIAEPGKLNNRFLDEVVGSRPAFLRLKDAHSGLASSAAIRLANYPDDSPHLLPDNPGWLVELDAMGPVLEARPPLTISHKAARLHEILQSFASRGFTEGFVMDMGDPDTLEILREAERTSPLEVKLRISPWIMPDGQWPTMEDVAALQGERGERWVIEGAKLFIDGTIDNGTAWLYEPDTHGEGLHGAWHNPHDYREVVIALHERGIPTSTHAIGDKGIDFVAETIAELPAGGPRHRIEHIETVTDEVIALMKKANLTASMQPTHSTHFLYADETDNWSVRLGHERAERGFRWRDIRDAGVPLAIGSDWPVAIADAPQIFASAQLCRQAGKLDLEPIRPRQALSALEVLEGMTTVADESVGRVPRSLTVGRPATITAFRDDPLTTAPDAFAETDVVLTMIDGIIVAH